MMDLKKHHLFDEHVSAITTSHDGLMAEIPQMRPLLLNLMIHGEFMSMRTMYFYYIVPTQAISVRYVA